jgi:hypothetical protein
MSAVVKPQWISWKEIFRRSFKEASKDPVAVLELTSQVVLTENGKLNEPL